MDHFEDNGKFSKVLVLLKALICDSGYKAVGFRRKTIGYVLLGLASSKGLPGKREKSIALKFWIKSRLEIKYAFKIILKIFKKFFGSSFVKEVIIPLRKLLFPKSCLWLR